MQFGKSDNMVESSTVRLDKPLIKWLNSFKGYLEYTRARKFTLSDALFVIMGEIEVLYASHDGLINRDSVKECEDFVNRKIEIFWENQEYIPKYIFKTPRDWLILEKDKKKK